MIRHPLRILITALAFYTVFPFFAGIHFLGNILEALGLAAATTLACSILYLLSAALETVISTRMAHSDVSIVKGLPMLMLYWFASYVVLPGGVLKLCAMYFPRILQVGGVGSLLAGGLIICLIGYFTGAYDVRQPESCGDCMSEEEEPQAPSSPSSK